MMLTERMSYERFNHDYAGDCRGQHCRDLGHHTPLAPLFCLACNTKALRVLA